MNVNPNLPLIPQTTDMSCWAAGIAMIRGWRDHVSIDPKMIATNPGGIPYLTQFKTGLNPNDTYILRRSGLVPEAPPCYSVAGFSRLVQRYGPPWVASAVPGPHIRAVTGVLVGATAEKTTVSVNDPWEQGMRVFRRPNRGFHCDVNYTNFATRYETLGRRESSEPAPIYIAHLP
jgi:hypothetical protein